MNVKLRIEIVFIQNLDIIEIIYLVYKFPKFKT